MLSSAIGARNQRQLSSIMYVRFLLCCMVCTVCIKSVEPRRQTSTISPRARSEDVSDMLAPLQRSSCEGPGCEAFLRPQTLSSRDREPKSRGASTSDHVRVSRGRHLFYIVALCSPCSPSRGLASFHVRFLLHLSHHSSSSQPWPKHLNGSRRSSQLVHKAQSCSRRNVRNPTSMSTSSAHSSLQKKPWNVRVEC